MAVVGIDLGTTNTVIACVRESRVHVLSDEQGNRLLPSVVSFHPSGDILVGRIAKERRTVDARNTIASVKRLIGRSWQSEEITRARQRFAFELKEGPGHGPLVVARGQDYTLPEISAFILKRARQIAEAALGEQVDRAVITVPANFNELQRASTKVAGRVAGLDVLRILNEPTAAALAYGLGKGGHERIAIFDFGGGTFDCTLLDLSGNVFEVLATAGDTFLGGDDIDTAVAERMADAFLYQHRFDPRTDPQAFERLRVAAEHIKMDLSVQEQSQVHLREVAFGVGGAHLDLSFGLTRAELEAIAEPYVERTLRVCQDALQLAKIPATSFDKVILVGGSTRIPIVRARVEAFFQMPPLDRVNPDEVVAIGAAIQAAALTDVARRRSIPAAPRGDGKSTFNEVPDDGDNDATVTNVATTSPAVTLPLPTVPGERRVPTLRPAPQSTTLPLPQHQQQQPMHTPPMPPVAPSALQQPSTITETKSRPIPSMRLSPADGGELESITKRVAIAGLDAMEDMSMAPVPTRPEQTAPKASAPKAAAPEPFEIPTPGVPIVPQAFGQIDSSVEGPGPEAPSRSFHLGPTSLPGGIPSPVISSPLRPEPLFPAQSAPARPAPPPPAGAAAPTPTGATPAPLPGGIAAFVLPTPGIAFQSPDVGAEPLSLIARMTAEAPGRGPMRPPTRPPAKGPGPTLESPQFPGPAAGPPPSAKAPPLPATMQSPQVAPPQPGSPPAAPRNSQSSMGGNPWAEPPSRSFDIPGAQRPSQVEAPPWMQGSPQPLMSGTMPMVQQQQQAPMVAPGAAPVLVDVTPRALVVETVGGFCDTIIQRNAKIPCEKTRAFATARDMQTIVHVRVAQGEAPYFAQNTFLGQVELSGLAAGPRGAVTVAVTFALDANGILQVSATDVSTGREARATLQLIGVAEEDAIAQMVQRSIDSRVGPGTGTA